MERVGPGICSRILLMAPQPVYQDRGTPIAVSLVAEALCELGVEVDLLTYPIGEDLEFPGLSITRGSNPLGISEVPIGFSLRKVYLNLCLLPSFLSLLRKGTYDAIIAVEEAVYLSLLVGKRLGIPVVYDMQSCIPDELARHPVLGSSPAQALLRRIERWALKGASAVVCSSGLRDYVENRTAKGAVSEWHFPVRERPVAASEVAAIRRDLEIPEGALLIVYTGNDAPNQGIVRLIEAAALVHERIPNAMLLLAGLPRSSPYLQTPTGRQLETAGILKVLERQPRKKIYAILEAAQVLVSPRASGRNVPLKIFDYLATGKPIVATGDFHRQVLREDCAILVEPTSSSLAEGIVRALEDDDLVRVIGKNALEFAERELGWDTFRERVGKVVNSTTRESAGAGGN